MVPLSLTAAAIVGATFLTSILSGMFGMAGGLILMGLFAWLLPVASALALHGMIQLVSNLWRLILWRNHVAWAVLGWFALGSAGAISLFAVVVFVPSKLLVFVALGLMPILVWVPERWLKLDAMVPWQAALGGVISTGVSLTSGVSGPVTDLLFVHTELTRHQVVATKAVMQAIGHASKVTAYGGVLLGATGQAELAPWVVVAAVLASMAGVMVGGKLLDRLSDTQFRTARRWIVTVVGAAFLVQATQLALF